MQGASLAKGGWGVEEVVTPDEEVLSTGGEVVPTRTGIDPLVGAVPQRQHRTRSHLMRSALIVLIALIIAVAAFLTVTLETGFPGPGPFRRYSLSELNSLAAKVNRGANPDCPPPAEVSWLSDRVEIPRIYIANPPPGSLPLTWPPG